MPKVYMKYFSDQKYLILLSIWEYFSMQVYNINWIWLLSLCEWPFRYSWTNVNVQTQSGNKCNKPEFSAGLIR